MRGQISVLFGAFPGLREGISALFGAFPRLREQINSDFFAFVKQGFRDDNEFSCESLANFPRKRGFIYLGEFLFARNSAAFKRKEAALRVLLCENRSFLGFSSLLYPPPYSRRAYRTVRARRITVRGRGA